MGSSVSRSPSTLGSLKASFMMTMILGFLSVNAFSDLKLSPASSQANSTFSSEYPEGAYMRLLLYSTKGYRSKPCRLLSCASVHLESSIPWFSRKGVAVIIMKNAAAPITPATLTMI